MKNIVIILLLSTYGTLVQADVTKIDNKKLMSLIEDGVPIIDIRRKEEWQQTGIVKDSFLITFFNKDGKADVRQWLQKLDLLASKEDPFILICRTGRRTGIVADFLDKKLGYKKIYDVTDGITDWIKKGHPTVKP